MAYCYVASSLRSTAVKSSLVCNFTGTFDQNLILSRGNRFEVHKFTPEGLLPVLDVGIYGSITSMAFYRPMNSQQDVVFILTEKKHFCILSFDSVNKKLLTKATGNLRDKVGRDLDIGHFGIIDPEYRCIGLLLYEGLMKVIPILNVGLGDAFNVRIEELKFIDVRFLHGCPRPTICVLYEDNRGNRNLKTYVIDIRNKILEVGPWNQNNVEQGSKFIIPVTYPTCGIVLLGEATISYINGTNKVQAIATQRSNISAFGSIDVDGSRYLLGDDCGLLQVLIIHREQGSIVTGLSVDILGITSIPQSICYLDNGVVFIGSVFGDSQLIKLLERTNEEGNHVEVLDTYSNVGPISDMCVVESERQGQCRVITCSGAGKDGSLRVIRSGIGIEEQASIELRGIKGIWSLKNPENITYDKYLIQSFIGETRILGMEEEQLVEIDIPGFSGDQSIHCANLTDHLILQVTTSSARIINANTLQLVSELSFTPKKITNASSSSNQLLLTLSGGTLVYIEVRDTEDQMEDDNDNITTGNSQYLQLVNEIKLEHDIACITLRPIPISVDSSESFSDGIKGDNNSNSNQNNNNNNSETSMAVDEDSRIPKTNGIESSRSSLAAVGMWTDNTIRLFALPTLQEVHRIQIDVDVGSGSGAEAQTEHAQARDVLLIALPGVSPALLVGLGDGVLVMYTVDVSSGLPKLINKKRVVLGTHPLSFCSFFHRGSLCVFISCDRPTVLYSKNSNMVFSAANLSEVTGMAPFHSESFPDCLAFSSESGLTIGTVDDIQKIHIQTYHVGEAGDAPRRICHSSRNGIYAVCTQRSPSVMLSLMNSNDEVEDRILFLDDVSMHEIHSVNLEANETTLCCTSCTITLQDKIKDIVIVGTAISLPEEPEPSNGRLIVYEITSERRVCLVTQKDLKGAVYTVATMDGGKVLAGVGSKVQLFKWMQQEDPLAQPELQEETVHKGCILALYLKVRGDLVIVGDMIRSITLLRYRALDSCLEEVARDYNANYMRAIAAIDDHYYLGSEDCANLFVLRQQDESVSEDERSRLETFGEMHLGDYVNVFRHGILNSQPPDHTTAAAANVSESTFSIRMLAQTPLLFGTVSGSVGAIIPITEESYRFFSALERAVNLVVVGLGGLTHADWRGFYNDRRSSPQRNMIDGDVVEKFLDLSRSDMSLVVKHLNDDLVSSSNSNSSNGSSTINIMRTNEQYLLTSEEVIRRVEDIARMH